MKNVNRIFALLLGLSFAGSLYGEGERRRDPRPPRPPESWSCRADDASGSGLFYISVSRYRGEARDKALDTCYRFVDRCTVSCTRLL